MSQNRHFQLFVYGTLKRGYENHRAYCAKAFDIAPANTWGRLYHLAEGYPALEVPQSSILAQGSADILSDVYIQQKAACVKHAIPRPNGDWDLIEGEVVTFANPTIDLPPIDILEDFYPDAEWSMYKRVLMPVQVGEEVRPAWLYNYILNHKKDRILSGNW